MPKHRINHATNRELLALLRAGNVQGYNAYRAKGPRTRINFPGADFSGIALPFVDFGGYEYEGEPFAVDLTRANFTGASLGRGNFEHAWLENAILVNADLHGACLRDAHLTGADLSGANLENADLSDAVFEGAKLDGTKLLGANLWGAKGLPEELQRAIVRDFATSLRSDTARWEWRIKCSLPQSALLESIKEISRRAR